MDYISLHPADRKFDAIDTEVLHSKKLTLPSGETIDLSNPDALWECEYKQAFASSKLEVHSLLYLFSPLLEYKNTGDEEYLRFFETQLQSFLLYMKPQTKYVKYNSSGNAIFKRTILFCKCLMVLPETWLLRNELIDLMLRQANWLLDDANYAKNNHGVMIDLGLLHLAVLFSHYDYSKEYGRRASERIMEMFQYIFYEDGFCNENTVKYFRFNIMLFKEIAKFCNHYGIYEELQLLLNNGLDKQIDTLRHLIWQNGYEPPIGDAGTCETGYVSINQSKFFKDANIALVKDDYTYFTMKCGWTSRVHKHADETSITLRHNNTDLIIDSGFYNHDIAGRYRPLLSSFRGHSGIYPIGFDGESWASLRKIFSLFDYARIDSYEQAGEETLISASYAMKAESIKVTRSVVYEPGHILITDSWKCKQPQKMRQSFVLPGSTFMTSEQNFENILLRNFENENLRMRIQTSSFGISMQCSLIKGICSPVNFHLADAWWLDFCTEESLSGQIITDIIFGD